MNSTRSFLTALMFAVLASSFLVLAQNPPAQPPAAGRGQQPPPQPMSFFITSTSKGGGATWHAYLSTQGPNAVNARDRIGSGPWYNQKGQRVAQTVAELHGDTIE